MTRLRPRNWSLRVRLTVLYGGLFFLAGAVLLVLSYFLVWQGLSSRQQLGTDVAGVKVTDSVKVNAVIDLGNGQKISVDDLLGAFRDRETSTRDAVLGTLLVQGSVGLVAVGLVAVGFGWLLARGALQPVNRITETAQRIASADTRGLHERIQVSGPHGEVARLAMTFNAMLERLDRSFDGQRRFVANASHEMRTPLAVQRALIEVTTTREGASADARQLGETLLEINGRHEGLIDGLLMLADSENEPVEAVPVDLAELAESALEVAAEQARARSVRVEPPALEPAPVVGDPLLLERLVQNLVENAVRHNDSDGWLRVTTAASDGRAVVAVSNSGPVIRAYEIDTLFQPFRRLDRHRGTGERGFGLGLSIVRAIARAHGGEVTATPRDGGGLDVRVSLPTR